MPRSGAVLVVSAMSPITPLDSIVIPPWTGMIATAGDHQQRSRAAARAR